MVDLQTLCRTTPSVAIADGLLGLVNARMRTFLTCDNPEDSADETIQFLLVGLSIHASKSLQYLGTLPPTRTDLLPLEALNQLVNIGPHSLEAVLPTLVLDAILAYPTHVSTVSQLITGILANNAPVATAFRQEVVEATVRLLERENSRILKIEKGQDVGEINLPRLAFSLLVYSRAHPTLASAIVSSRNLFEILKVSYEVISGLPESSLDCTRKVQSKSHLLLLLHTLLEPLPPSDREWKLEMMEEQGQKAEQGTMVDTGISHDYHLIFQGQSAPSAEITTKAPTASIGEKQMDALRSLSSGMKLHTHREDETYMIKVSADQRIAPILVLFPDIPPDLLHEALRHPRFAKHQGENGGEDDPVTVLTNAMLDNTLPPELDQLARKVRSLTQADTSNRNASASGSRERSRQASPDKTAKKTYKRDNIFNDMPMDLSRLNIGKSNDDLDSYTAGIPEHIRASILRLSEQQVDEEEAEREALREEAKARRGRTAAAGPSSRPEPRTRTVAFEEELDAEDLLDDETDALEARVRLNLREGEDGSSDGESYVNSQEDDDIGAGGTEDVYLEQLYMSNPKAFDRDAATRRNKLRDQMRKQTGWSDEQLEGWRIMLERNPLKEKILARHGDPRGNRAPAQQNRGNEGGRGRDGGGGSRGGGQGGGSGRGRGGSNKSSRGHQNAARTRGHDRKMAKMGGI